MTSNEKLKVLAGSRFGRRDLQRFSIPKNNFHFAGIDYDNNERLVPDWYINYDGPVSGYRSGNIMYSEYSNKPLDHEERLKRYHGIIQQKKTITQMTAETLQRGVRRLFNLSGGAVSQRLPEVVAVLADPPTAVAPPAVADALLPPTTESADALLLPTVEPLKVITALDKLDALMVDLNEDPYRSSLDLARSKLLHPKVKLDNAESLKVKIPKERPPKVEPPKVEPPKVEPPKVEPPKVEPPKVEPPKVEPPKVEPPKVEPTKVEATKVETPKVEATKVEATKVEPPKVEPPKERPPKERPPKVEPPKTKPSKVEAPKTKPPKAASSTTTPIAASSTTTPIVASSTVVPIAAPSAISPITAPSRAVSPNPVVVAATKSVDAVLDIEPDVEVKSKEIPPPYTKEDETRGKKQAVIELISQAAIDKLDKEVLALPSNEQVIMKHLDDNYSRDKLPTYNESQIVTLRAVTRQTFIMLANLRSCKTEFVREMATKFNVESKQEGQQVYFGIAQNFLRSHASKLIKGGISTANVAKLNDEIVNELLIKPKKPFNSLRTAKIADKKVDIDWGLLRFDKLFGVKPATPEVK